MKSNGIQAVKFRVTLNGHGVVNYDSKDQKFFINAHCAGNATNDNQTFAKKEFYSLYENHDAYLSAVKKYAEENELAIDEAKKKVPEFGSRLKISYNCLRREIFGGTSDVDSVIWNFPTAASNYIANPLAYSRGYMCPDKKESFKKKGCFNVTDAVDENAVLYMEMFTKSGDRNDTSLFYKETAGDTKYVFSAYFDVKEAQFLSFDDYFARKAVSSTYIEGPNYLENAFKKVYGRVPYTVGVYSKNNDIFGNSYGEYGAKMDDEFVNGLIKTLAGRLLSINIIRNGGEAYTVKVEYKPVYTANDIMESDEGWIELKSSDEIPYFDVQQFYEESSHQEWEERKAAAEAAKATSAAKKTEKKTRKTKKGKDSEEGTAQDE